MSDQHEETSGNGFNKLMMEAMMAEMKKLMTSQLEEFRQEMQQHHSDSRSNKETRRRDHGKEKVQDPNKSTRDEEADIYYGQESSSSRGSRRKHRRTKEDKATVPDGLGGLKLRIPPFHGKNDPDAYLDWEKKIELVFNCQHYTEINRVNVAATKFYDYALSWWDQIVTSRRRNQQYPVKSWSEMKSLLRKRFVPSHYHQELHQRIRRLTQGNRTVEDYYQELETLMLLAEITEDGEATMSRFLGGLNREIQDRLEMQQYEEIEEMLHKAILIEQQLKRRYPVKTSYGVGIPTKANYPKEEKPSYQRDNKTAMNPKSDAKPPVITQDHKSKPEATTIRSRDVRCFKCHGRGHYANECSNKRVIVLLDSGEIESEEEKLDDSKSNEEYEAIPASGELLVARRTLNIQSKEEEQEQTENLFHTRCLVQGKVCSLIIDGGSCTNVASEEIVNKLGLKMTKHPKPYKLRWLNEIGEMKVQKQVLVPISIGKYEDEVLRDVLAMEAGHILLGRPWQSDRKVLHDGFTNKHSFVFHGRKITLIPLKPQEVYQDQVQMKQKEKPPKKSSNFFLRAGDVKKALVLQQPILLFVFKKALANITDLAPALPSKMNDLL
ncbi:uncharacterized protein LOC112084542 [Eutrema salsugineum]|uniref:uncharacterized protein LOC112084542 n=1 Tax=Eutrema salsugineum TaxID=72664 RepID=UPI000CECE7F6|nr:uncharacterized protein LOC112084542 [Eutrema salsugineum]